MSNPFFDRPILNSPYEYPRRHWELDEAGQPTQKIMDARRGAKFIAPIWAVAIIWKRRNRENHGMVRNRKR